MRKIIKRSVVVLLAGVLLFSLSGCKKKQKKDEVQRYAWPLGTSSPEDTVTQLYAEKFAKEVSRLSHGKMKIEVYPNSTLGGDRELLESCKDGDIPFVVQNTAPQVTFLPDTAVFDLPSAFTTIQQARAAVDNEEFYQKMEKVYQKGGYKLLGYADQGFRVMSTNKNVKSINDFKGQKIRTMENSYHLKFWKTLGANPTPMTFSEVYIGLQQGTIDGHDNSLSTINSANVQEVQKYISISKHAYEAFTFMANAKKFDTLTPDTQQLIRDCVEEATKTMNQEIIANEETLVDKFTNENGCEIYTFTEDDMAAFKEVVQPLIDEYKGIYGAEACAAFGVE